MLQTVISASYRDSNGHESWYSLPYVTVHSLLSVWQIGYSKDYAMLCPNYVIEKEQYLLWPDNICAHVQALGYQLPCLEDIQSVLWSSPGGKELKLLSNRPLSEPLGIRLSSPSQSFKGRWTTHRRAWAKTTSSMASRYLTLRNWDIYIILSPTPYYIFLCYLIVNIYYVYGKKQIFNERTVFNFLIWVSL